MFYKILIKDFFYLMSVSRIKIFMTVLVILKNFHQKLSKDFHDLNLFSNSYDINDNNVLS